MRKPRLTARIVEGLRSVYALADVNMVEDSDLYKSASGMPDGAEKDKVIQDIDDAISWLGSLINWYEAKQKPKS
jgi:hypothetical protein